jgi:hypothetical protein
MINDPKKFKEGDSVAWQNGPIRFKEKIVKMKDGRLAVKGISGLIPITSIHLPLEKIKPIKEDLQEAKYTHSVANVLALINSLKYKFTKSSNEQSNPYSSTKSVNIIAPGATKIDFKKLAELFKSKGYQYSKDSHYHIFFLSNSERVVIDTKPEESWSLNKKFWHGSITLTKKAKATTLPYYD